MPADPIHLAIRFSIAIMAAMVIVATIPSVASAVSVRDPTGPVSLPSIGSNGLGSLPLIGLGKAAGIGPPPHQRMHQLADRFGDVMTLSMGREPWVILSSPEVVHEAFVTKGTDFSGRPMVPSMSISSGNGQGFAKKQFDPELTKLRQMAFSEFFDSRSVERSLQHFKAETELLVDHWVASSASSANGGVAIRPGLRRAVTNMVLRHACSVRVPYDGEETASPLGPSSPLFEELVDVVDRL